MTLDIKISKTLRAKMLAFAKRAIKEGADVTVGDDNWIEFSEMWDLNIYWPDADDPDDYSITAYPCVKTGENTYSTLTNSWVVLRASSATYSD